LGLRRKHPELSWIERCPPKAIYERALEKTFGTKM